MTDLPVPETPSVSFLCDVAVDVAPPIVVGDTGAGVRRVIPILGGTVKGRINGRVLASGADFQIIRHDSVAELEALYVIETEHGLVYVKNYGLRDGPKDVLDRLARGEMVDPRLVYFRASPRFETAAPELQWLTKRVFVCSGARLPDRVVLRFFELL
ncbi:MAG: DUF3237 domain-containing protein [Rhodoblastus sp.]